MTLQEAERLEEGDRVILEITRHGTKFPNPRTGTIERIGSEYVAIQWDEGPGELYMRDEMLQFSRYNGRRQQ